MMGEFKQPTIERHFKFRHRISVPQESDDTAKREELSRAIERIRSLNPIWEIAVEDEEPENYALVAKRKEFPS
jgi:hypothetical protein